jgi:hypothetical protein
MHKRTLPLLLLHSEVDDSYSACTEACCNPVLSVVPGHLKDVTLALVALDKGAVSDAPDVQVPSKAATSQVVTTAAASVVSFACTHCATFAVQELMSFMLQ